MLRLVLSAMFLLPAFAWAIDGAGNPWETIDDALCAGLVAEPVPGGEVVAAARKPADGPTPAHCRVDVRTSGGAAVFRLPLSRWTGAVTAAGDDALRSGAAVSDTARPEALALARDLAARFYRRPARP